MTEVFTAEITILRPVDAVWARLIDWNTAAQWMSGVDALRADGPTAAGTTLVSTTRGKQRTGQIAALVAGRSITLRSIQGGGDCRLRLHLCAARRRDAGEPSGRLPNDRSRAAARPGDQLGHPQGRQRPARRVRRHVHSRMTAHTWWRSSSWHHRPRLAGKQLAHVAVPDSTEGISTLFDLCRPGRQ
jgi:hypothetical protein